jgi:hypothetical protein
MEKIRLLSKAAFVIGVLTTLSGCTPDNGDRNTEAEMENPYSNGTGHYAGYEWAENNGGSCNGNSESFNEGCEEYNRQLEELEKSQN